MLLQTNQPKVGGGSPSGPVTAQGALLPVPRVYSKAEARGSQGHVGMAKGSWDPHRNPRTPLPLNFSLGLKGSKGAVTPITQPCSWEDWVSWKEEYGGTSRWEQGWNSLLGV